MSTSVGCRYFGNKLSPHFDAMSLVAQTPWKASIKGTRSGFLSGGGVGRGLMIAKPERLQHWGIMNQSNPRTPTHTSGGIPRAFDERLAPCGGEFDVKRSPPSRAFDYRENVGQRHRGKG